MDRRHHAINSRQTHAELVCLGGWSVIVVVVGASREIQTVVVTTDDSTDHPSTTWRCCGRTGAHSQSFAFAFAFAFGCSPTFVWWLRAKECVQVRSQTFAVRCVYLVAWKNVGASGTGGGAVVVGGTNAKMLVVNVDLDVVGVNQRPVRQAFLETNHGCYFL